MRGAATSLKRTRVLANAVSKNPGVLDWAVTMEAGPSPVPKMVTISPGESPPGA